MNLIKRSILSLLRNKKKSISIFLVLFTLFNLIASSYAISSATNIAQNKIKKDLSGIITIHADMNMSYIERINWKDSYEITHLVESYLTANQNIQYYDVTFEGISYIKEIKNYIFDKALNRSIYVVINEDFEHLSNEKIVLIEGRTFTKEEIENGDKVIIVNKWMFDEIKELENNNINLKIGDKINLCNLIKEKKSLDNNKFFTNDLYYENEEYEIIGFYRLNKDADDNNFWPTDGEIYSKNLTKYIYMPLKTAEYMVDKQSKLYNEFRNLYPNKNIFLSGDYLEIKSILIKLETPERLNATKNDILNLLSQNGYKDIKVITTNDAYELIAGPVESLSEIASLIFKTSFIVSIAVLGLVILLTIRDRKQEIGLYLSLGERKSRIIIQLFLEIYIIGILALSLSLFSGLVFGQKITDRVIENTSKTHIELYGDDLEQIASVNDKNLTLSNVADSIEFEYNAQYIISIYVTNTLVISLSIILSMIYLIKLNPKEILL